MDLRTFLRPNPVAVQAVPAIGEMAPDSALLPRDQGQPRLVTFLRHTGCPFAEATLQQLRTASLVHPGIEFVAASHASAEPTSAWCDVCGGAEQVRFVHDETRALYAAWGLGLTSLGHFLGRRSLAGVLSLARQGIHNRHPSGTRWQMAGTFAIDAQGIVRWRHLPVHAGDLPDLAQAMESLST